MARCHSVREAHRSTANKYFMGGFILWREIDGFCRAESAERTALCTSTSEAGQGLRIRPWDSASGLHGEQLMPRKEVC